MRCGKIKQWISAGLDNELTAQQLQALQAHVASCERCRSFAADLEQLQQALGRSTAAQPRPGFVSRMMAKVDNAEDGTLPTPVWTPFSRVATVCAALVAFALGTTLVALADKPAQAKPVAQRDALGVLTTNYLGVNTGQLPEDRLLALIAPAEED